MKRILRVFLVSSISLLLCLSGFADSEIDASRVNQADKPLSDSWQSPELLNLAKEFRKWRRSFQEGIPDYAQIVKEQLKGLKEFRRRLDSIDSGSWPIPAKVDYLVVLIDMNRLEFDLKVIRQVSRSPDFYTSQAV